MYTYKVGLQFRERQEASSETDAAARVADQSPCEFEFKQSQLHCRCSGARLPDQFVYRNRRRCKQVCNLRRLCLPRLIRH